jgi:hypothetical protein
LLWPFICDSTNWHSVKKSKENGNFSDEINSPEGTNECERRVCVDFVASLSDSGRESTALKEREKSLLVWRWS